MLNIISIEPHGIAAELGIKPGDRVISVNGHSISDQLDYRFYSAEEHIELEIQRDTERFIFDIRKAFNEDIGIELEEMKMMACGNACVFCFVFQNPKGMRKSMYFKDEDYRFSFLYGHYVTLTSAGKDDLERIVRQQLSPLYVSIHATEEKTRRLLLGIKHDDLLLEKIRFLIDGGIEIHAQIVLCPEINDGDVFDQTVNDLKQFFPGVRSIAIVPVGLTRHRRNLFPLRIHTTSELKGMIAYTDHIRQNLKKELSEPFIYLADEFFIKADSPLPGASYYEEFYQIENGVGEFRKMIDGFTAVKSDLPQQLQSPLHITWVTGMLAANPLNRHIISDLRKIKNLQIDLVPVRNEFYGPDITVSGLLVGEDIYKNLKNRANGDIILLPPRVLNHDGLFLDDWTVPQLEDSLNRRCHVPTDSFESLITNLSTLHQMV
jgi:putative radical SAM enzyme (TIGR03279 family)